MDNNKRAYYQMLYRVMMHDPYIIPWMVREAPKMEGFNYSGNVWGCFAFSRGLRSSDYWHDIAMKTDPPHKIAVITGILGKPK